MNSMHLIDRYHELQSNLLIIACVYMIKLQLSWYMFHTDIYTGRLLPYCSKPWYYSLYLVIVLMSILHDNDMQIADKWFSQFTFYTLRSFKIDQNYRNLSCKKCLSYILYNDVIDNLVANQMLIFRLKWKPESFVSCKSESLNNPNLHIKVSFV